MTFGHYTADTAALTRSLSAIAAKVAAFADRVAKSLAVHGRGGTPPWPVAQARGVLNEDHHIDRRRVAGDRKRRKQTRRLHSRLRKMGRDRHGSL
jgi:hypothetical protein